jgi:hypothetical protein
MHESVCCLSRNFIISQLPIGNRKLAALTNVGPVGGTNTGTLRAYILRVTVLRLRKIRTGWHVRSMKHDRPKIIFCVIHSAQAILQLEQWYWYANECQSSHTAST